MHERERLMFLIGALLWAVFLAVYVLIWTAVLLVTLQVHKAHGISLLSSDGSPGLFTLRVITIAMPLFAALYSILYVPWSSGFVLEGPLGFHTVVAQELVEKPRWISDGRVAGWVSLAVSLFVSSVFSRGVGAAGRRRAASGTPV